MATLEELSPNQIEQLHKLQTLLSESPETRSDYLRLIKKVQPNLSIPEIDAADSIRKELNEEREERKKLEAKLRDDDIRRNLEASRLAVKSKHKLSDEQLGSVEKLMVDRQIHDYDLAAEFYHLQNKPADPSSGGIRQIEYRGNMLPTDAWKGVNAADKGLVRRTANKEAINAINEIRQQNR